jgi:hypothetical protein
MNSAAVLPAGCTRATIPMSTIADGRMCDFR